MLRKFWLGSLVVGVLVLVGWSITAPPGSSSYVPGSGEGDCRPEKALLPMLVYQTLPYFEGPLEVEPNNSPANANGPIVSGATYQGQGSPLDQNDYFRFYLATAGQIIIDANNDTGTNVQQVQLFYQTNGNLVETASGDPPYHIDYSGLPGWYYIRIYTAPHFNLTANYTFQASYSLPPTPTVHPPVATPTCPGTAAPSSTPTKTPTPSITPSNTPGPSPTPTETVIPGWHEVGDGSATGGGVSQNSTDNWYPFAAVAPNGTIYLAWEEVVDGDLEIYLKRWSGGDWEEVGGSASGGGISDNTGTSAGPSVAIAPDGTPYVAWQDDDSGNSEIYVKRWDGANWEEVGPGSATGGGISDNDGASEGAFVDISSSGNIYIVWQDNENGDYEVYIRRWNGTDWVMVGTDSASGGGISNNDGDSFKPSIDVTSTGTPYVVWHDDTSGNDEIYVLRWTGTDWEEVGGSASGGGISNSPGISIQAAMAMSPSDVPYVTWRDNSTGDSEIYVRRLNGTTWEQVGGNSATGGGISNNDTLSFNPSIAVAPNNTPYIAWHDDGGGDFDIYVLRLVGNSWVEVGIGSAFGEGISVNDGNSSEAWVAISPGGTPHVAWQDNSDVDLEIYIRRWLGP